MKQLIQSHLLFFTTFATLAIYCGCAQNSNPANAPALPATSILDTASTMIFTYSVSDTGTIIQTHNYRVRVDSIHRTLRSRNNVSAWSGAGGDPILVNYSNQGLDVMASNLFLPYSGISDWVSFPFDYAGSVSETRRLDSSFVESGQQETAKLRDTLRNLGTEYVRVGGEKLVTTHYQGSEYVELNVPQLKMTQINRIVADYWYAPAAGYFVVQDRYDTYQTSHERIEMLVFAPN